MKTAVLKFGGSSFPKIESYLEIAEYVAQRAQKGEKIALVVSAMSGTTGKLQEIALQINPNLSLETTDAILGTGEILAAGLMRAALEKNGLRTAHFTGFQNGIVTDDKFTRAEVREWNAEKLCKAFEQNDVLVFAGGQAQSRHGQLTMLGRNSSDLSAVLLAGILGVPECEIFSDVPGVYTADPYVVPSAQCLPRLPYDLVIDLSRSGSKVLHYGSVRWAQKLQVKIVCKSLRDGVGTIVGDGRSQAMTSKNSNVLVISGPQDSLHDLRQRLLEEDVDSIPCDDGRLAIWNDCRRVEATVIELTKAPHQVNASGTSAVVVLRGWCLVSVVGIPQPVHTLVSPDQADDLVRKFHASFYGEASPARIKKVQEKAKSKYSDLLV
jgi:aspartate kinase